MRSRDYSFLDKIIIQVDACLLTVFAKHQQYRDYPAKDLHEPDLTSDQKRKSAGLMRVNHSGEVCAQALYNGQLVLARDEQTRSMLQHACDEETDHLAWTEQRLRELNDRTSYLNIFWYLNSFMIGLIASRCGDDWSLGFVEETEIQVTKHLDSHLGKLPAHDTKSQAVVQQMKIDEARHSESAANAGARELTFAIKKLMSLHGKVMTTLAYWD